MCKECLYIVNTVQQILWNQLYGKDFDDYTFEKVLQDLQYWTQRHLREEHGGTKADKESKS
jgi:hypothetical protein